MTVIDASVLVAAAVDSSADGEWAESQLAAEELVAPEIVLPEAMNVLRRLELAERLTTLAAGAAMEDLLSLPLVLLPYGPFSDRAWALRATCTIYDAWYVAIAEELDQPLATLDARLASAPGPRCDFLLPPGSPHQEGT